MFGRLDLSHAQFPGPRYGGTVFQIAMGGARDHVGTMRPLNYIVKRAYYTLQLPRP